MRTTTGIVNGTTPGPGPTPEELRQSRLDEMDAYEIEQSFQARAGKRDRPALAPPEAQRRAEMAWLHARLNTLTAEVTTLRADKTRLQGRLDTAKTEYRTLRETLRREEERAARYLHDVFMFRRERDRALQERDQARGAEAYWRGIAAVPMGSPDLAPLLKRLLALAHPDKWSQGQPAVDLAHELAIAINAAREKLEGLP